MIYQPLQIFDIDGKPTGRWHFTVTPGQSGLNPAHKHACCRDCDHSVDGHATAADAIRCFDEYESRRSFIGDTADQNQYGKCLECGEITSAIVVAGSAIHRDFRLCPRHHAPEIVAKHYLAELARK